ncbi:peptidoglycan hydrolase-like protein with peptidoglycan-binding domain [Flavobacterium sp. PL11]|jgi:peptidoglycan hydrolase-like protein with peptidoglycan-binding domain|uniref:peptidoglycan-binding protein n=1 Tax=Flavobacterium sp. PL11 TaxID=3071717 RepID=UPI002DFB8FEE|nr:peptidoglycan hydrolase-like protein with peptidoglycan-binding domain [Flavobacterium sp. PL11]
MQKTFYQKELLLKATQQRRGVNNNKKEIEKIQSWLSLFSLQNPSSGTATGIDGDFGPATEKAVMNFQKAKSLSQTGVVNQALFDLLVSPMKKSFTGTITGNNLRELIINVAKNHLINNPFELVINQQTNSGPWVRAYMDGHEGNTWLWCMGFVQTILDQAASIQGKNFKTLMPLTYSCDTVGTTGLQKNILTRFQVARRNPALIKPGDVFLIQRTLHDWTHTGIVINVSGDVIETIEGNTNGSGSANGNAVVNRIRNYKQSKIDFFSIKSLV